MGMRMRCIRHSLQAPFVERVAAFRCAWHFAFVFIFVFSLAMNLEVELADIESDADA